MAHIIINPSLSAAIAYNLFFNPPKFAEVSAILEPANSTRTDYRTIMEFVVTAQQRHRMKYIRGACILSFKVSTVAIWNN